MSFTFPAMAWIFSYKKLTAKNNDKKSERVCSVFLSAWPGWQCSVSDLIPSRYMMKMGGNAAFSFRFSFVTEGLGGNAPFFKVFLTIFSVFERQCTVFLTLFGPISRLGLGRFLGGYAPFYPNTVKKVQMRSEILLANKVEIS